MKHGCKNGWMGRKADGREGEKTEAIQGFSSHNKFILSKVMYKFSLQRMVKKNHRNQQVQEILSLTQKWKDT